MSNELLVNVFNKLIQEKNSEITELKKDKEKNKKEINGLTFKVVNFSYIIIFNNKN